MLNIAQETDSLILHEIGNFCNQSFMMNYDCDFYPTRIAS